MLLAWASGVDAAPATDQGMLFYVDHTTRFAHNTGIQRCVRLTARALIELGIPLRPVCWRPDQGFVLATSDQLRHLERWNGPAASAWTMDLETPMTPLWLLVVELVREANKPTPQQMQTAARAMGLKVAWVFHDAIPIRLAHLYGGLQSVAARSHAAYMRGLSVADRVLANSHTTAEHLRSFLNREQLPSTHGQGLPLAQAFPTPRQTPPPEPHQLGSPLRLLCVGSLEARKNHRTLLKALAWLEADSIGMLHLRIVGWANDAAIEGMIQRAVHRGLPVEWIQDVDDARLNQLYAWAQFTVYPSIEEGFGLPVAESLWHGRGCLCSGEGALGELAAEGGCLTVDTRSWRLLADALHSLLRSPYRIAALNAAAQQRRLRSWSDYGQQLLAALAQA